MLAASQGRGDVIVSHLDFYEADSVWQRVQDAFAHYGKRLRPLRGARREHMMRLLSDGYTADELVAAIHGYVHWHGGLADKGDGFDPSKWFTPESVFRLEKLEARIEFGLAGPFVSKRDRVAERARTAQEERAREIAKVMEERRLRAV